MTQATLIAVDAVQGPASAAPPPPNRDYNVATPNLSMAAGGCKYHNFLNSGVNPFNNYIFGILTLRAIDWYVNESILRGSEGGVPGGVGEFWGGSPEFCWATFTKYLYIFGILSSSPVDWHPCWVI